MTAILLSFVLLSVSSIFFISWGAFFSCEPKNILSYAWSCCRHSYSLWRAASGHRHPTRKRCFKCQTKAQPSRTKDTLGQSAYEKNENNVLYGSYAESFQEWTSFSGVQCDRNKYQFFNLNDEIRGDWTQEYVLRHKELLDQHTTDALTSDLDAFAQTAQTRTVLVRLSANPKISPNSTGHETCRFTRMRCTCRGRDIGHQCVSELSSKSHEGTTSALARRWCAFSQFRRTSLRAIVRHSPAAVIADSTWTVFAMLSWLFIRRVTKNTVVRSHFERLERFFGRSLDFSVVVGQGVRLCLCQRSSSRLQRLKVRMCWVMHVRSNAPLTANMLSDSAFSCCRQIIVNSLLILAYVVFGFVPLTFPAYVGAKQMTPLVAARHDIGTRMEQTE